jgi:glycosyltransferase involved in cell wall biosynthesis
MYICLVVAAKIPVKKYGGTERIVQWLAAEFVSAGHKVCLVGLPGCDLPGVTSIAATSAPEAWRAIPADVDIVHFHSWEPPAHFGKPWIYTLHGNSETPDSLPRHTVCISADHARRHGRQVFVYNGVDPSEFIYQEKKSDHLLFFSKVRRRVKGARRALKLAKTYQQDIVMAGGYRFDLLKVGGLIDSLRPGVSFKGELGGAKKAAAFSEAKALLFPIDWEEPFGLVVIESLLSGTPVVATRRGSLPELINDSVGAFFDTDEQFPAALAQATSCKPSDCRDWAVAHFSSQVCAQNYLKLYERVLQDSRVFDFQPSA